MNVPPRHRLPIAIVASVAVVAVVFVVVLIANGGSPNPIATPSASASASASTDPGATPEGAVRAFFEAYARARQSDDPSVIEAFVTGKESSAYLSAAGFLRGQKEKGKASVMTVLRLDNMKTQTATDSTATVTFDYTEGGYNIDPATGSALESPAVLPVEKVTVVVHRVAGRWLVDAYQTQTQ